VCIESIGEMNNAYQILVGNPESKRPVGRPRCRWEDHIRMDVREKGVKLWTGYICLRKGTSDGLL